MSGLSALGARSVSRSAVVLDADTSDAHQHARQEQQKQQPPPPPPQQPHPQQQKQEQGQKQGQQQEAAQQAAKGEAASGAGEAGATQTKTPEQRVQELTAEVAETKDKLLRAYAEMQNVRMIAQRDVQQARTYAIQGFAKRLLDVADNLERALDSVPAEKLAHPELKTLHEGVHMTYTGLTKVFTDHGVSKVCARVLDALLHQRPA